jgi:hypothetical protein
MHFAASAKALRFAGSRRAAACSIWAAGTLRLADVELRVVELRRVVEHGGVTAVLHVGDDRGDGRADVLGGLAVADEGAQAGLETLVAGPQDRHRLSAGEGEGGVRHLVVHDHLGILDGADLLAVQQDGLLLGEGHAFDPGVLVDDLALDLAALAGHVGGHQMEILGVEVAGDLEAAAVAVLDAVHLEAVDLGLALVLDLAGAGRGAA